MSALTVWKFDDPMGAQEALNKLVDLSKQHLIEINDAAIVSWAEGKKKPKTQNYGSMTGRQPFLVHSGVCFLASSSLYRSLVWLSAQ